MNDVATLKAVSQRLNQTPINELPRSAGLLAAAILDSTNVIQKAQHGQQNVTSPLHRIKTRVSALLQDRTLEGRSSGIIVVKALIEAGGDGIINESANWVRQLLSCLNKPDPSEVKRLCILTLTRTFLLTSTNQASIAQVTTPNIPAFIAACLNILKTWTASNDHQNLRFETILSSTILRCFCRLIEHFPTVFRPHVTSIRACCLAVLNRDVNSSDIDELAADVLAQLHSCAPKNAITTEWSQMCTQTLDAAHNTSDLLFRSFTTYWTPSTPRISKITRKQRSAPELVYKDKDSLGLDGWHRAAEGSYRLTTHLLLLRKLLCSMHVQTISLPFSQVLELISRLCSVATGNDKNPTGNPEFGQDEHDVLCLYLPQIHVATVKLLSVLVDTFGQCLYPVAKDIMSLVWDIFEIHGSDQSIRTTIYSILGKLLDAQLTTVARSDLKVFASLSETCCSDIRLHYGLEATQDQSTSDSSKQGSLRTMNLASPSPSKSTRTTSATPLSTAAIGLLPRLIQHIPHALLPISLRAQLDHTAIITNNHEAMLASVIFPPRLRSKNKPPPSSIIPFYAQTQIVSLAKEALLRPRVPVIRFASYTTATTEESDENSVVVGSALDDSMAVDSPAATPIADLSSVQSPVKRDFASVLEQSANVQLAGNVDENEADSTFDDNAFQSSAKRPRFESGTGADAVLPPVIETRIQSISTNRAPESQTIIAVDDAIVPKQAQPEQMLDDTHSVATFSQEREKELVIEQRSQKNLGDVMDEDSSSDESAEPVIDGTLAWELSDDDDEKEDE